MRRTIVAVLALVSLLSSCGGKDGLVSSGTGDTAAAGAVAQILTTGMTRTSGSASGVAVTSGESVPVGVRLDTDATGLSQLDFPDGSLTRLGPSTSYTVVALTATPTERVVEGDLTLGDTWHQVKAVTGGTGRFEVSTPVGVAAVRGTAFAVQCARADSCVVSVVEGSVEFTPTSGPAVTLSPGQRAAFGPTGQQGATLPVPAQDPWVRSNQARDRGAAPATSATASPGESAACALITREDAPFLGEPFVKTDTSPRSCVATSTAEGSFGAKLSMIFSELNPIQPEDWAAHDEDRVRRCSGSSEQPRDLGIPDVAGLCTNADGLAITGRAGTVGYHVTYVAKDAAARTEDVIAFARVVAGKIAAFPLPRTG